MSVDTIRKSLTIANPVSPTTVYGWPAVIFSLPFIAVGAFIVLSALDVIHSDDASFHVSRHLVAAFGGLFFLAGLMTLTHGFKSLKEESGRKDILRKYPGQSWLADYRWNPKGIAGDDLQKIYKTFGGAAGMTIFLIPFHWFWFTAKDLPGLFRIIFVLFDCVLIVYWGYGFYFLLRFLKYGKTFLQFNQFPFFLDDKVDATLNSGAITGLKDMTVTLRCIEEKYEVRGTGKHRSVQVVSYQTYADTLKFENMQRPQHTRFYLPVSFPLPNDKNYETTLSARPARYWQMEFKAATPGIDYLATFLIPVYMRDQ